MKLKLNPETTPAETTEEAAPKKKIKVVKKSKKKVKTGGTKKKKKVAKEEAPKKKKKKRVESGTQDVKTAVAGKDLSDKAKKLIAELDEIEAGVAKRASVLEKLQAALGGPTFTHPKTKVSMSIMCRSGSTWLIRPTPAGRYG